MISLLMTLLCLYCSVKNTSKLSYWLFVIIFSTDFLIAGLRVNPTAPDGFFTDTPGIVRIAHEQIGDGRLYHSHSEVSEQVKNLPLLCPSDHVMWPLRWNLESLNYYPGSLYKIPIIFHQDPTGLAQSRIVNLTERVEQLSWEKECPYCRLLESE